MPTHRRHVHRAPTASRPIALALPCAAALLASAPRLADAAATETFEVRVHAICPDPQDVCGWGTEADFRTQFESGFLRTNTIWRPTNISLHPTFEFEYERDELLDLTAEDIAVLKAEAAADPTRLTLYVVPQIWDGWVLGFSAVPAVGTPPTIANDSFAFFSATDDGVVLAHELGHHFCLPHTFSGEDFADHMQEPNHDGDGLVDTPPDPGLMEYAFSTDSPQAQAAADAVFGESVTINPAREWCDYTQYDTDPGSPGSHWCTADCKRNQGGTMVGIPYAPDTQLVMSYYAAVGCDAPWVVQGIRTEALSGDQIATIAACRALVPERTLLVDICDGNGGDSDHDGFCDTEDLCPQVALPFQIDSDGNGIGDFCEGCPGGGDNAADFDLDGQADSCDGDDDNDGCIDEIDQDPLSPFTAAGTVFKPNCPELEAPIPSYAGVDSDGDGQLDCSDADDDDDGIPDDEDACLTGQPCTIFSDECVPPATCHGPGCDQVYDLVLVSVVNPQWMIDIDRWQLDEAGTVWIAPEAGWTVSETAQALRGHAFPQFLPDGELRLELRRGREPVQVLAQYSTDEAELGNITHGSVVMLRVEPEGRVSIAAVWGAGLGPDHVPLDTDADGSPDTADVCTLVHDPRQTDLDRDGFGDRCDPDFDQDGRVTELDLERIYACLDYDVATPPVLDETLPVQGWPDAEPVLPRSRCRPTDLDGSGIVDDRDVALAERWLGQPPGPAAHGRDVALHDAPHDDELELAADVHAGSESDAGPEEDETPASSGCGCSQRAAGDRFAVLALALLALVRGRRRAGAYDRARRGASV